MPVMKQESEILIDKNQEEKYLKENIDVKDVSNNLNILIVDDDDDIIDCYKYIFEYEGFNIESAYNPHEALKKAKENKYVIAILD
jgi:PleD family two-component response regulator